MQSATHSTIYFTPVHLNLIHNLKVPYNLFQQAKQLPTHITHSPTQKLMKVLCGYFIILRLSTSMDQVYARIILRLIHWYQLDQQHWQITWDKDTIEGIYAQQPL